MSEGIFLYQGPWGRFESGGREEELGFGMGHGSMRGGGERFRGKQHHKKKGTAPLAPPSLRPLFIYFSLLSEKSS